MLNRDRKTLIVAMTIIYVTVLIPIVVFTTQMVISPRVGERPTIEPDLFRELYEVTDDLEQVTEEVEDEEEAAPAEPTRRPTRFRKTLNETERQAIRDFRAKKEVTWKQAYYSPRCIHHRRQPPGLSSEGKRGMGLRAACVPDNKKKEDLDYQAPSSGSVDVSLSYRAIYVPQPKGASQIIQDAFKRRFKSRRISDRNLPLYLQRAGLKLSDFFVFTFVRNPFDMFHSAYKEVSKLADRNKTAFGAPFAFIGETRVNEPRRAIAALSDSRNGFISPPHLYTQLWKVQRCTGSGSDKKLIDYNFIGHLETIDEDWRFIEMKLNATHRGLPRPKKELKRLKLLFDPVTSFDSPWSTLTKHVCDFYRSDFDCFGFNRTLCES